MYYIDKDDGVDFNEIFFKNWLNFNLFVNNFGKKKLNKNMY